MHLQVICLGTSKTRETGVGVGDERKRVQRHCQGKLKREWNVNMYLSKVCRNVSTKWWHIVILRWAHMVLHSISTFINVWSKKKSFGLIWGCVNYGRILDVKKSRQACEEVILFGLWSGEQLSSMCCWWSNRSSCELWVCDMEVNRCTQCDHGNCWEKRGVCCATRNRECLFKES